MADRETRSGASPKARASPSDADRRGRRGEEESRSKRSEGSSRSRDERLDGDRSSRRRRSEDEDAARDRGSSRHRPRDERERDRGSPRDRREFRDGGGSKGSRERRSGEGRRSPSRDRSSRRDRDRDSDRRSLDRSSDRDRDSDRRRLDRSSDRGSSRRGCRRRSSTPPRSSSSSAREAARRAREAEKIASRLRREIVESKGRGDGGACGGSDGEASEEERFGAPVGGVGVGVGVGVGGDSAVPAPGTFVWTKKIEQALSEGASARDFSAEAERARRARRVEESRAVAAEVAKREAERDAARRAADDARRLRAAEDAQGIESKEEKAHLEAQKGRAARRVREGRARVIDALATVAGAGGREELEAALRMGVAFVPYEEALASRREGGRGGDRPGGGGGGGSALRALDPDAPASVRRRAFQRLAGRSGSGRGPRGSHSSSSHAPAVRPEDLPASALTLDGRPALVLDASRLSPLPSLSAPVHMLLAAWDDGSLDGDVVPRIEEFADAEEAVERAQEERAARKKREEHEDQGRRRWEKGGGARQGRAQGGGRRPGGAGRGDRAGSCSPLPSRSPRSPRSPSPPALPAALRPLAFWDAMLRLARVKRRVEAEEAREDRGKLWEASLDRAVRETLEEAAHEGSMRGDRGPEDDARDPTHAPEASPLPSLPTEEDVAWLVRRVAERADEGGGGDPAFWRDVLRRLEVEEAAARVRDLVRARCDALGVRDLEEDAKAKAQRREAEAAEARRRNDAAPPPWRRASAVALDERDRKRPRTEQRGGKVGAESVHDDERVGDDAIARGTRDAQDLESPRGDRAQQRRRDARQDDAFDRAPSDAHERAHEKAAVDDTNDDANGDNLPERSGPLLPWAAGSASPRRLASRGPAPSSAEPEAWAALSDAKRRALLAEPRPREVLYRYAGGKEGKGEGGGTTGGTSASTPSPSSPASAAHLRGPVPAGARFVDPRQELETLQSVRRAALEARRAGGTRRGAGAGAGAGSAPRPSAAGPPLAPPAGSPGAADASSTSLYAAAVSNPIEAAEMLGGPRNPLLRNLTGDAAGSRAALEADLAAERAREEQDRQAARLAFRDPRAAVEGARGAANAPSFPAGAVEEGFAPLSAEVDLGTGTAVRAEPAAAAAAAAAASGAPVSSSRFAPRKPKYFNRVHTGYDWNRYNKAHYDGDNPPPKTVVGYKFSLFYPDLVNPREAPEYELRRDPASPDGSTCLLVFKAGPPYEDVAFRIVNRDWDLDRKRGFKSSFERGVLHLFFNLKRERYRR